jgi:hypothetical protein
MLQIFHLDVVKVDRVVAWRGRWLSLLLGRSHWATHVGSLCGAWVPCDGRRRGCWGATRDADVGAAQVSEPRSNATSRLDIGALGVSFVELDEQFLFLGHYWLLLLLSSASVSVKDNTFIKFEGKSQEVVLNNCDSIVHGDYISET